MPRVLLESESIRHRAGPFRSILADAGFDLVVPPGRASLSPAQLAQSLADVDAVIMGAGVISRAHIEQNPQLRAIARTGVGFERVDLVAANERRVVVTITPDANHEGVAEHTLGLILALAKRLTIHNQAMRRGTWDRSLLPLSLRGRTLGIVGFGRIGQAVADRARAFGMQVVASSRRRRPAALVAQVSFEELLACADVISLHLPLTDETQGLCNHATFARMKPGVLLINTGRGGLIVEADLVAALHSGQVGGVGLDVFDPEPPQADHPLWSFETVIVTPHMAGLDESSVDQMALQAAEYLVQLYRGDWPAIGVVNPEIQVGWRW